MLEKTTGQAYSNAIDFGVRRFFWSTTYQAYEPSFSTLPTLAVDVSGSLAEIFSNSYVDIENPLAKAASYSAIGIMVNVIVLHLGERFLGSSFASLKAPVILVGATVIAKTFFKTLSTDETWQQRAEAVLEFSMMIGYLILLKRRVPRFSIITQILSTISKVVFTTISIAFLFATSRAIIGSKSDVLSPLYQLMGIFFGIYVTNRIFKALDGDAYQHAPFKLVAGAFGFSTVGRLALSSEYSPFVKKEHE